MTLNVPNPQFQGHAILWRWNGTTYRHSFNEILIGTFTRPIQQRHFEWLWVSLSDLAKYSMTRSVERTSLCDSWASCFYGGRPPCWVFLHNFGNGTDIRFQQNLFFVFLMHFGLRRAAAFASSPKHLFVSFYARTAFHVLAWQFGESSCLLANDIQLQYCTSLLRCLRACDPRIKTPT